jgi:tryptophanyl-tRNA synthetase
MHRAFSPDQAVKELDKGCRSASIGCIDCKRVLFKNMMAELTPIRKKALSLKAHPDPVLDALRQGAVECKRLAAETMAEVREVLGLLKG